jgi:hypothetical protein
MEGVRREQYYGDGTKIQTAIISSKIIPYYFSRLYYLYRNTTTMTHAQFELLSKVQQMQTIRQYGELVAERVEGGNRLYLYVVNSFYIELLHELINNKGLVIARVFDDISLVDSHYTPAESTSFV